MIKLTSLLKEALANPDTIILPFNIYYIEGNNETLNIGLDTGTATEPKVMMALWGEYQQMQDFETSTKSGGDKFTNKMQDVGFNTDSKADADRMFFGRRLQELLSGIELYVPEGTECFKNGDVDSSYSSYYDDDGNDFMYSKQEADKYKYMLTDDEGFKEFVDTVKDVIWSN